MFNKFKKIFLLILLIVSFGNFNFISVQADPIWGLDGSPGEIKYCNGNECGLNAGMNEVHDNLGDEVVKDGTASQYVQKVIAYLLGFITLIAVIYIIYAGFRVLTSSGDDETIKTSKKTIMYVIIGIVLIWFAYEIAYWATNIGEEAGKIN